MNEQTKAAIARIEAARKQSGAKFYLEGSNLRVRRKVRGNGEMAMCPLQFLHFYEKGIIGTQGSHDLAVNTGLPHNVVATIVNAADHRSGSPERLALLAAAGVEV